VNRFSFVVAFWLPFVFAASLCGLALVDRKAAWPTFCSFLPLAFLFVAFAFGRVLGEVRRLQERVQALETSRRTA
jgi:hypothetical protein